MPPDHYQGGPEVGAPNQKALFERKFEDEAFISRILSTVYESSFHTDDYPFVRVRLTFDDGTLITASSKSQQPYMLPWSIEIRDAKLVTYNANISRALNAILPKKTVNRSRISGNGLVNILKTDIARAIEPEANFLDADNRAASALAKLREHYTLLTAEINGFHHVEYGTQWSGNQPHEENLHVTLKRADLPPSLVDALVLEYRDGKVGGVDTFLGGMNKYENLVLSVPWLVDYMRSHQKVPVRISFVHDASLGSKGLSVFVGDMHAIGKDDLAVEAKNKQSEVALFITGNTYAESYWLIFPDKRTVLWRYNGPSGLLNWKPSDFSTVECADYGVPFGGCVGAVIEASGRVAAP
jgi:hypothetical protein